MIDDKVYCALPWMQVMVSPSGDYKVCCFSGDHTIGSHGYCLDDNGEKMNVLTHSFEEALNSKTSRDIREAQKNNQKHPQCAYCWSRGDDTDATKVPSFRHLRTNIHFKSWGIDDPQTRAGKAEPKVRSLDLRFTNTCNLKCIMCSPLYSSGWYEDHLAVYGTPVFGDSDIKYQVIKVNNVLHSDMPRWHDTEIWKARFDSVKHDLQHIYVTGGEPFIIKGHLDLLDDLIENDLAKNIVMDYDTNLTVVNPKILSRLSKFKHVRMSVSLDDIGDRYNYFRFPGNFSSTFENLQYVLREKTPNIEISSVSMCLGILNVFAPLRFSQFIAEHNLSLNIAVRLLRAPYHFDIKYLLPEQKKAVIEVYKNTTTQKNGKRLVTDYLTEHLRLPEEHCAAKVKEHTLFLDTLDGLRGTDWRSTYPETFNLLTKNQAPEYT